MSDRREIFVKTSYDHPYKVRLWRAVVQELERIRGKNKRYRPGDHFEQFIRPELEAWTGNIYSLPDGKEAVLNFQKFEAEDPSELRRYLRASKGDAHKPELHFSDQVAKIYDAYFKIKHPAMAATFEGEKNIELFGEMVAGFLKDKSLFSSRYDIQLIANNLIGLYEYEQRGIARRKTGLSRYFSLFESPTKEYFLAVDFYWEASDKKVFFEDEELDLYFGFVVPGKRFSTVLMRSLSFRYRQTGLLYTAKGLVEHQYGIVDEIILDTMTTDELVIATGENERILESFEVGDVEAFAKLASESALLMTQGPRTSNSLKNITDKMLSRTIETRISKFILEYL